MRILQFVIAVVFGGCLVAAPLQAAAITIRSRSSVESHVESYANSGGFSGTEVNTDQAEARSVVETTVNGVEVESIDERVTSQNGEPAVIDRQSSYQSEDGTVTAQTSVRAEAQSSSNESLPSLIKEESKQSVSEGKRSSSSTFETTEAPPVSEEKPSGAAVGIRTVVYGALESIINYFKYVFSTLFS